MSETNEAAPGFSDYLELTKPRLSLLSVITALIAFESSRPIHAFPGLFWTVLCTSVAAGGVATLNQMLERDTDARMARTAGRPIPTGRIPTGSAFVLGTLMCIASLMLSFAMINKLTALFLLLTIFSYLGFYTPAKRWSRWSTEIGAVAGAIPPLIGWAAGAGSITALGWILFGVLFFWQVPHFMAVSWTHRKDYAAVNFPMPSVRDQTGRSSAICSLLNTVLLVAVSLLPVPLGLDSEWYGIAAAVAGAWILWRAGAFMFTANRDLAARRLFLCSIAYLPLVLGVLVVDRLLFY